ncbi:c-type cytochrome [Oceanibacterium hippocampi]|uniref:Cytochrome c2 n=1 Tax=Oceanibacterium hippocampi TaxID=745714 RepID=A0A1Y5SU42_9PROT|nr:c-type cytochrome [Oceanibacterium hippocampi]SLN48436.1 Cytochrome c2 precursor [Oceanibacterium hippocampi]
MRDRVIARRPPSRLRGGGLRQAGAAAVLALLLTGAGSASAGAEPDGEKIYQRCFACHSVERNRTGPRHCGLNGRAAGSVEGYNYSKAMRNSHIVWNKETLDAFLANPRAAVPGTIMAYAGVKKESERAALVDWLLALPPCE